MPSHTAVLTAENMDGPHPCFPEREAPKLSGFGRRIPVAKVAMLHHTGALVLGMVCVIAGCGDVADPVGVSVDGDAEIEVESGPPAEGLIFNVDWATSSGNGLAAITDGGKLPERYCIGGSGQLIRVVPRASDMPATWPANMLQVDISGSNCDNVGTRDGGWPVPAVGETLYMRMLMRPNTCGMSTGPIHNLQSNVGRIAWSIVEEGCSGGMVPITLRTYLGDGRAWTGAYVPDRTPVRAEWAITHNPGGRAAIRVRIYNDATGQLIADENSIRLDGESLAQFNTRTGGFLYSSATEVFSSLMIGQQGPVSGPQRTGAYHYGGFAVSASGWVGPYVAGEGS